MPPKKKAGDEVVRKVLLGRPSNNVKMGIVGMPNVGKSSFFNCLSKLNVPAENFPFCTIDPNVAMVPVPDPRFKVLCGKYAPKSEVPPTITITDIAGLVKGAAEGAGLGNAFLSHIGATDALFMMLRAFESADITHVEGDVDPVRDIAIITEELLLKDIEVITKVVEASRKNVERGLGGREKKLEFECLEKVLAWMRDERKQVRFGEWTPAEVEVLNRHQLLTAKEIVYLVNLSKRDFLRKANKWLPKVNEAVAAAGGGQIIPFSVEFEQEWVDEDMGGTLEAYKAANPTYKSMMARILKTGYQSLQLIHYFTAGADEVKAWTIKDGWLAPQAAGVIHTDFEKGFICAEVMTFEDLKELGDEEAVKKAGKMRQQGKRYVVQDGDIIYFKFNN
ncbi:OLA1, Obg-like ATPase 1 [Tribonema minus]|uniref:Obg-like ATPase 1 n=1 Tax=Tribonema minus TaxID=303371 RepID=A0A835YVQ5_9STRA|nr:OLA1, Obg-like ATPase 1 [Tribonema minus]